MPITSVINDANITAPAEISFAMPTIREYRLWKIESSVNSIAVFNISETITIAIANKIKQYSIAEKSKKYANKSIIYREPKPFFLR